MSTALDRVLAQVGAVVTSAPYKAALTLVDSDPAARASAAVDPSAFMRSHGVELPAGSSAKVISNLGSWSICVHLGPISICYQR